MIRFTVNINGQNSLTMSLLGFINFFRDPLYFNVRDNFQVSKSETNYKYLTQEFTFSTVILNLCHTPFSCVFPNLKDV